MQNRGAFPLDLAGVFSIAGVGFGFTNGTLTETYAAMVIAWIVLYPLCWLYRRYKRAHPQSLARYL